MGDAAAVLERWLSDPDAAERMVHVERSDPEVAVFGELAEPLTVDAGRLLEESGITALYRHQAQALNRIRAGRNTVLVAGASEALRYFA